MYFTFTLQVPTEIVDIDLSRGEHLDLEFIKINPKHQVPVFVTYDDDGGVEEVVTESREIAKHFHAHFNLESDKNDHWYPSDPTERAKVDAWLAFSDKNHMTLCMPALMTAINTFGMPWRKTAGVFIARMSAQKKKDPQTLSKMKEAFAQAEAALAQRQIASVQDLNLGDLALYLECSLAFAMNVLNIKDYPGLNNLYQVMKEGVPEFQEIDEKFCHYTEEIVEMQKSGNGPSVADTLGEVWASVKFLAYLKWNRIDMMSNKKEEN